MIKTLREASEGSFVFKGFLSVKNFYIYNKDGAMLQKGDFETALALFYNKL